MKKALFLFALFFTLIALPVFAVGPDIGIEGGGMVGQVARVGGYSTSGVTDTTLSQSIGKIVKVVLSLTGTIFFALTVYAGLLWMTAQGNEEQVTKATGIIKMAVIGLLITLAAYGITTFVVVALTGATTVNQSVGGTR